MQIGNLHERLIAVEQVESLMPQSKIRLDLRHGELSGVPQLTPHFRRIIVFVYSRNDRPLQYRQCKAYYREVLRRQIVCQAFDVRCLIEKLEQ